MLLSHIIAIPFFHYVRPKIVAFEPNTTIPYYGRIPSQNCRISPIFHPKIVAFRPKVVVVRPKDVAFRPKDVAFRTLWPLILLGFSAP
jgi:hypothetical protein